jgi:hypothetical protein
MLQSMLGGYSPNISIGYGRGARYARILFEPRFRFCEKVILSSGAKILSVADVATSGNPA